MTLIAGDEVAQSTNRVDVGDDSSSTRAPDRSTLVAFVLGLVLVGCVFAPGLDGAFVWDDRPLLLGDSPLRGDIDLATLVSTPFWGSTSRRSSTVSPLYGTIHRPLIKVYLNAGTRIFGNATFGYHAVAWALHLMTSALVFGFLRRRPGGSSNVRTATSAVIAILFALHPTKVEAVSWISGIPDLAMTFFVLLGLEILRRTPTRGSAVLAFSAFVCAGWCKETAVLVPALVACDAWANSESRASIYRKLALAGSASVVVLATWAFALGPTDRPRIDPSGGTGIGLAERVFGSIGAFVERVVVPFPATIYPGTIGIGRDHAPSIPMHLVALGIGAVVALAMTAFAARRRPSLRGVVADALWFLVPLLPVSNVVLRTGSSLIADRYLFLSSIGMAALAARGVDAVNRREVVRPSVLLAGAATLCVACAIETASSIPRFADGLALFSHEARVSPEVPAASREWLVELEARGRFDQGAEVALAAAGRFSGGRSPHYEATFVLDHLRMVSRGASEWDQVSLVAVRDALDEFERSGRLAITTSRIRYDRTFSPRAAAAIRGDLNRFHVLRAIVRERTLDFEGAEREARWVVERASGRIDVAILAARMRAHLGDFEGARRYLADVARTTGRDPRLDAADGLLASLEASSSRPLVDPRERAVRDANVAIRLGSPERARRILGPVLSDEPTFVPAIASLALAEDADRRPDEALAILDRALSLSADPLLVAVRDQIVERGSPGASIAPEGGVDDPGEGVE